MHAPTSRVNHSISRTRSRAGRNGVRSSWRSVFLLSASLSAAIASLVVPPLFGLKVFWQVPVLIVVAGAIATGPPVSPEGGTPAGWVFGALTTFANHYGTAFVGGFIVGAAGGGIIHAVCEHYETKVA